MAITVAGLTVFRKTFYYGRRLRWVGIRGLFAERKRETEVKISISPTKSSTLHPRPRTSASAASHLLCNVGRVTVGGRACTVSSVTHRYQLRKGKYEPSEKRLDP